MTDEAEKSPLDFRKTFKAKIRKVAEEEQALVEERSPVKDNVWLMYEGEVKSYDTAFSVILKDLRYESLRDWMRLRKESGLTTHVLDIMGGNGSFLRDLSSFGPRGSEVSPYFDRSLVITLADERSGIKMLKDEDDKRKISYIAGDITSGKTWHDVSEWLKSQGIPAFDLVICRGVQGLDLIPVALYPMLFEYSQARTTNENGLILTQLSRKVKNHLDQWKAKLCKIPGIKPYTQSERPAFITSGNHYPAIGIVKTNEAPSSLLPFIKD